MCDSFRFSDRRCIRKATNAAMLRKKRHILAITKI